MFMQGPYSLKGFTKMHKNCPNCNVAFEREPGYFFGAMYISYAISVLVFLVTSALVFLIAEDPRLSTYITAVLFVAILTYPVNFRAARVIFLHTLGGIPYDPKTAK